MSKQIRTLSSFKENASDVEARDTNLMKKVEAKEEITETAPDSSESCRKIIVRRTSTEAEAPPAML